MAPQSRLVVARAQALDCWHRYLYKPYYLYSPGRLAARFIGDSTVSHTRLPWGLPISLQPGSMIGTKLVRTGIHDLVLTEALFRITDRADTCVDAGANIGYTTSLLASRSGPSGRVISYEPAPDMFELLTGNIRSWRDEQIAAIDARQMGLSNVASQQTLVTPTSDSGDASGRTLERVDDPLESVSVKCSTLDSAGLDRIDVLKIDVEGHELAVLEGSENLLARRAIRDIVFEDYRRPPTAVTDRLAEAGYSVFRVEQGIGGPRLIQAIEREFAVYWDAPNYLATVDPQRAVERFRMRGWRCLRSRRH